MKLKLRLLTITLLLLNQVYGQNMNECVFNNPVKTKRPTDKIIYDKDGKILVIETPNFLNQNGTLYLFDKGKKIWKKKFSFPNADPKKAKYIAYQMIGDKLYFVYRPIYKEPATYAYTVGLNGEIPLQSVKISGEKPADNNVIFFKGDTIFILSYKKADNNQYNAWVNAVGKNFEPLNYEYTFTFSTRFNFSSIESFGIDGNLLRLQTLEINGKDSRGFDNYVRNTILHCMPTGKNTHLVFTPADRQLYNYWTLSKDENTLLFCGNYKTVTEKHLTSGVWTAEYNKNTGELTTPVYSSFSEGQKSYLRSNSQDGTLSMPFAALLPNNNLIIINEYFILSRSYSTGGSGTTHYTSFSYNDIYVTCLDETGKIKWHKTEPIYHGFSASAGQPVYRPYSYWLDSNSVHLLGSGMTIANRKKLSKEDRKRMRNEKLDAAFNDPDLLFGVLTMGEIDISSRSPIIHVEIKPDSEILFEYSGLLPVNLSGIKGEESYYDKDKKILKIIGFNDRKQVQGYWRRKQ